MHDSNNPEQQIKEWYQQYSNHIFRYILVIVGEREQARDLMQETYVKAFKNYQTFKGDSNPKTWLFRIARNVTIDYQRKKKPIFYFLDSFAPIKSNESSPQEVVELGEDIEYLYNVLSQLKKNYREVIVLRKIKEFSIKETAFILGWKESRVKTTLHRGLELLRQEMVKEGYTNEFK
ncbi:RNA polymerase sigma factor [Oceanobacillus salinisoli]|uniref:RNA polymerase sigma factor n=1 Tax=Oceanobacillus salinisoli TaxID=2678611 RepID=UPI0012E1D0E8|nr:RNA polymerase sigma factor [Oceanobacillus salinisoli]